MQIRITDATPEVVAMTAVFERNVRITTSAEVTGVDAGIPTGCNATPDVQTPRQGQEAKVIATEGEGYAFVGWFQDGIEVSKSPVYVFPAEVDRHLVAKFRKADRTIVVGAPTRARRCSATACPWRAAWSGPPMATSSRSRRCLRRAPTTRIRSTSWLSGAKPTIRGAPPSTAAMCASIAWTATGASRP